MKIICIGNNYHKRNEELRAPTPDEPTVFMKPDTSLVLDNRPFYTPAHTELIHYEAELVIRICKNGKYIQKEFAPTYYKEVALGVDFTARALQDKHKGEGLPWLLSKGFDNSAPVSKFIPINKLKDKDNIDFSLYVNNKKVQQGYSKDMIFSFDDIIVYVSKFITLRMGDLIFTGTPAGVDRVYKGDDITGYIEDNMLLNFDVR